MNVLDDRLAHSNSAVVMATIKLFLHLTLPMPDPTAPAGVPTSTAHRFGACKSRHAHGEDPVNH